MNPKHPSPVPEDPRHHRFAVMLCEGYTLAEAYREAMQRKVSKSAAASGGLRLLQRPDVDRFFVDHYDGKAAQAAKRERIAGMSDLELAKRWLSRK